jgi:large subunit ribosomal protein L21e
MVQRLGGRRRKTRNIFGKKASQRGKFSLTKYFQTFKVGDQVLLHVEPGVHKGVYFRRFNARPGIVARKQGRCYVVTVQDGGKSKEVIVHPIHLRKL